MIRRTTLATLLPRHVAACTRCNMRTTLSAQSCGEAETRFAAAGWRGVVVPSRERGGIGLCPLCVAAERKPTAGGDA